jgi:DNA primase
MRFPPSFIEEIKNRLPVSDVVRRRVPLKKAGREWKGLSPFNAEKTPSFFVNDQKQAWFDFSSGKNGSIFDFVMLTEGVSFREAVERLAQMAGLPLPQSSPEDERREARRKTLYEVVELAAKFFEEQLQSRAGAKARGYLADRGLALATIAKFRLGYAPAERFALKEWLGKQKIPVEDMVESGMLIAGDDIPVPYDRFRDRVMFPIHDFKGRVVAFGGRALGDIEPKYLNSPETPLFHKGWLLYNGHLARAATQKGATLTVVEGYMDAIAMSAAGFEATVAPLGTALTEDQLNLVWRMSAEPVLCFDGDKAGQRAAFRALDLALPMLAPGKSLRFAILPEGQDPDDLIKSGGADAMKEVLDGARPLAEMLWMRETADARLDTPERRAALEAKFGDILRAIQDETVRRHYRDDLRERLSRLFAPASNPATVRTFEPRRDGRRTPRTPFQTPREALTPRSSRLAASSLVRGNLSALPPREALILLAVCNHPWLLRDYAEELADLEFANKDADSLRRAILDAVSAGQADDRESLTAALDAADVAELKTRMDRAISHKADWPVRPEAAHEDVVAWWHQIVSLHRRKRTLSRELKEAERALGADPTEANFAKLKDVQERLSVLDGTEALIEGFGALSGRPARTM